MPTDNNNNNNNNLPTNNLDNVSIAGLDPFKVIQSAITPVESPEGVSADIFPVLREIRSQAQAGDVMPYRKPVADPIGRALSSGMNRKMNAFEYDVPSEMLYTTDSKGNTIKRFESYKHGVDNEERLARMQSAGQQWARGLSKTGVRLLSEFTRGTIGSIYGIGAAVSSGNFQAVWNNDFTKWLEDVNDHMNGDLRNYRTQSEAQASFLKKMGTANFWADEFGQGMAFMGGMLASEYVWAMLTGGASIVARGASIANRASRFLMKGSSVGKNVHKFLTPSYRSYLSTVALSKGGKAFNNARFIYTSAGSEAGLEAYSAVRETMDNYVNQYMAKYGHRPSPEELASLSNKALNKSNYVYAANLALVGGSNVFQFGKLFGVGKGLSLGKSRVMKRVFGLGMDRVVTGGKVTYKALTPNVVQKVAGTTVRILERPFAEGVVEEGLQGVISKTHDHWVTSQLDPEAFTENYGMMQSLYDSFSEQYGTTEGMNEVFLGMLIGAVGGGGHGIIRDTFMGDVRAYQNSAETRTQDMETLRQLYTDSHGAAISEEAFNSMPEYMQKAFKNFKNANRYLAYINKANKSSEQGDFFGSNLYFNSASFSKLALDDDNGGTEQGLRDLETMMELTDDSVFTEMGLTKGQIADYKAEVLTAYKKNVDLYETVKDHVEALDLKSLKKNLGKEDYANLVSSLGLQMFLGVKSSQTADELAESINDLTGTRHGGALNVYSRLSSQAKTRVRRISQLKAEMAGLTTQMEQINNSIEATKSGRNTDSEQKNAQVESLIKKRAAISEKMLKSQDELTSLSSALSNAMSKRGPLRGGIDALFGSEVQNPDQLMDSETLVAELERFNNFLITLEEEDPEMSGQLSILMGMYEDQLAASQKFLEQAKLLEKGKGFRTLSELYLKYNKLDQTQTDDEIFNQYLEGGSFDGSQELVIRKFRQMEKVFNLQSKKLEDFASSEREPVSLEEYKAWKETGQIDPETRQRIINKIVGESRYQVDPEKPKTAIVAKRLALSPREYEMYQAEAQGIDEAVRDAQLERGDALGDAMEVRNISPQKQAKSSIDNIDNEINRIKTTRKSIDDIAADSLTKEDIPTDSDFDEYEELTKKSKTKLSPKKRAALEERLEALRKKINTWGRLQGIVEGESSITDLIEQKVNIDELTGNETLSVEPNYNDHNTLDTALDTTLYQEGEELPLKDAQRRGNHHMLQTYDKGIVAKVGDNLEISNVSLEKVTAIITRSGDYIADIQRDKYKRMKSVTFTRVDGTGEPLTLRVGQRGRIVLPISQMSKLNATAVKVKAFSVKGSGQIGGFYKPLLQEQTTSNGVELVPIDSDFTLVNNSTIDVEAVYQLKSNSKVTMVVDMKDPYNQQLKRAYESKVKRGKDASTELQALKDELVIYAKDSKGRVVGVFKNTAEYTFTAQDSNNAGPYLALRSMRETAVEQIMERGTTDQLDLKATIPVEYVYVGHPKFNLESGSSNPNITLVEPTEDGAKKVVNVGFYQNGELSLKMKTSPNTLSTSPFGRLFSSKKFVENNPNKKVPVAVINHKGRQVVYPISLKSRGQGLNDTVDEITNLSISTSDKINRINTLMAENGINPNDPEYGLTSVNYHKAQIDKIKDKLVNDSNYANIDTWLTKSVKLSDIVANDILFNVDINNEPFHSPKIKLDFTGAALKRSSPISGANLVSVIPDNISDSVENQKACK